MKTVIAWVLCFLVVTAGTSFAAESKYQETKFKNYLVRVTEGPAEAASIGSYSIHVYENNGDQFITGAVLPRDGTVVKVWAANADGDAAADIFIWTRSAGSGSYGDLAAFKFNKGVLRSAKLRAADESLLKGYMGQDEFDIKNGVVFRSFPVFLEKDSNCCPTGGTRTLRLDSVTREWKISGEKLTR